MPFTDLPASNKKHITTFMMMQTHHLLRLHLDVEFFRESDTVWNQSVSLFENKKAHL